MAAIQKRPTLILIRGAVGSGKSTAGKYFKTYHKFEHRETDMYFMVNGVFVFNNEMLQKNHDRCLESVESLLRAGKNVVVTNCFRCRWEVERYTKKFGGIATIHIYRTVDEFTPDKPVPPHIIERSKDLETVSGERKFRLETNSEGKQVFRYV